MELFTLDELLRFAALELERTVLKTEQLAIDCELACVGSQVEQQEVQLAIIRYRQAQNQTAQAVQSSHP
jgi:hypothetical protein